MTEGYQNWFDEQMDRIRDAVEPTFKSIFAERRSNREKIKSLEKELAACLDDGDTNPPDDPDDNPPDDPDPPIPPVGWEQHPSRSRVVWATGLSEESVIAEFPTTWDDVHAVVLRADVINRPWYSNVAGGIPSSVPRFAYVRMPVHYALQTGTWNPYEDEIRKLIEANGAQLKNADGTFAVRSPYDGDCVPWRVDLDEFAKITANIGYDPNAFNGIMLDGTVTNQLYALNPYLADYDGNGIADHVDVGWYPIRELQLDSLLSCANKLRERIPSAWLIGNGSWEPAWMNLQQQPSSPLSRWEYMTIPPDVTPSPWLDILHGIMIEDGSYPFYHSGRPDRQGPRMSQNNHMMATEIARFIQEGKRVWIGGRYRLFDGMTPDKANRFLASFALLMGISYVSKTNPFAGRDWGAAITDQTSEDGIHSAISPDLRINAGSQKWIREFQGGKIVCDMPNNNGYTL